ncbi:MAG: SOS response-associated peptidase [Hydrogenibacillus schlegelii]|nr:SOS response-associated peptidase [Hydrogenibacillus schlegelii]
MCGRFVLDADAAEIARRFLARPVAEAEGIRPRYNIAPGTAVAAVAPGVPGERRLGLLRWGLKLKTRDGVRTLINLRIETLTQKPAFGRLFSRRLIVPATGFYEWGADRRPRLFFRPARPAGAGAQAAGASDAGARALLALAAVWDDDPDGGGRGLALLTAPAAGAVLAIHSRMPVVLAPGDEGRWLDPAADPGVLAAILGRPEAAFSVRFANRKVGDPRFEGPACLTADDDRERGAEDPAEGSRNGSESGVRPGGKAPGKREDRGVHDA